MYEQDRIAQAAEQTAEAERRMTDLSNVLAVALTNPSPGIDLNTLKRRMAEIPLELGADAQSLAVPVWEDFEPPPPGALGRLFGEARRARERAEAELAFARAVDEYRAAESARQRRVTEARRAQAERRAVASAKVDKYNASVDRFAANVRSGDRHAVSKYVGVTGP